MTTRSNRDIFTREKKRSAPLTNWFFFPIQLESFLSFFGHRGREIRRKNAQDKSKAAAAQVVHLPYSQFLPVQTYITSSVDVVWWGASFLLTKFFDSHNWPFHQQEGRLERSCQVTVLHGCLLCPIVLCVPLHPSQFPHEKFTTATWKESHLDLHLILNYTWKEKGNINSIADTQKNEQQII